MNYLNRLEVKFLMKKGFAPANNIKNIKFETLAELLKQYEVMRKLIDIPEEILEDLQIKAVKAKKDLKNYIQDLLIEHVRGQK